MFPGIFEFEGKYWNLRFHHFVSTDGSILQALFTNKQHNTSRKKGSAAVDKYGVQAVGYKYNDWRSVDGVGDAVSLSKLVG